ncbi:MAG: hypothetical protein GVY20_01225 [Bacteroidetes bacterium]|jgi:hypothetical protein|nr:hypothetical protein [Bacteroidota bacterium]
MIHKNEIKVQFATLIFLSLLTLIKCSTKAEKSKDKHDNWKGTYQLQLATDSTAINFELELITGTDEQVYGYLRSDFKSYDSPISLDSVVDDSAFFHAYTNKLRLKKEDSIWQGKFTFLRNEYDATMRQTDTMVRQSLADSRNFLPLQFDKDFQTNAWATPVSADQIYFVSKKRIYLANNDGELWKTQEVNYDRKHWEFYSIGIAAHQSKLIAHGKPLVDSLPHQGGGDYYFLDLETPTKVGKITALPNSINTDSYDIFPWLTTQGDVLLSTWGKVEGIEQSGRGDIYIARLKDDGSYSVEEFDKNINTEEAEAGVFMGYDNRFIIFHKNNRKKDLPDRLFISRKLKAGWSEPEMIGPPVNRDFIWTYGGRIDPQGKYFYFNSGFRGQTEIYRVKTSAVKELREFY